MLSIGLMSGTSMDGIDAALLEIDSPTNTIKDLCHLFLPYEPSFQTLLKAAEHAVCQCAGDLSKVQEHHLPQRIDKIIEHSTYLHGIAVKKLLEKKSYKANQIEVVGYHGQTLFHNPSQKISIIIGEGQNLADQIGIKVVNDFRSNDIAAGGQGAPFAPLYHHALAIQDRKIPIAVVNCGGIANVTLIQNENPFDLIAFDTGPGNGLIDRLVRQRTTGAENMDLDGQYGKKGEIHDTVLKALYEKSIHKNHENYFFMVAPKSLDQGDMKLIPELDALSIEDACATLEAFTADTIVNSCLALPIELPRQWVLAGGGWKNPVIQQEFENRLTQKLGKDVQIFTADEIGWNSQAMEAQTFAYLAVCSLQNKPLSFPGTTGVAKPMSGGRLHIPKSDSLSC